MRSLIFSSSRNVGRLLAAALILLATRSIVTAQSGTWTSTAGGDYNTASNWNSNQIATGAGNTADFSTLDISSDVNVTLNSPLTIGNLKFGDTDLGSAGTWGISTTSLATAILTLNNGGPSPTITVNQLTPTTFDDAFIGNSIAGTAGLTKAGAGILTLGPGTIFTLTGGINVNAGTLRLQSALVTPEQAISLANGTTLETTFTVRSMTVAAGGTATVRATAALSLGGILPGGAGTTLNLRSTSTGQLDVQRDWTGFQNLNITGQAATPTPLRLIINSNSGAANTFVTASFTNTNLNLDNADLFIRTNSNGNTVPIGQLTGTSTGVLRGGNTGSAARWQIGGLNTSSTFSGVINGAGGLSIDKVGTGTLTLAGTFLNSPAIATGQNLARQGGVFRVTAGSLKITGASSIPGGSGSVLTTIDVLTGATFDVSGAPSTFATSALQKVQGSGTILGNYNHAAGNIQAGDVGAATNANEGSLSSGVVATAGTITFNGNLALAGGSIVYDMSLSPASGNDLVQVTGTTTLTSGKIVPNLLNGLPSAGQTYTVLNSTGGFSGAASNLTVDYAGRGTDPVPFVTGNNLQFTTPAGGIVTASIVWTGSNGTAWDVETTQNWNNAGNPDKYFNFDDVTFNESATSKTVALGTVVSPTSMVINNTSAYSFTGAGAIVGATGLTKTGSGGLSMQLNNTFTGPASVTGSSVNIAGFTGLGAGPLTLNNATLTSTVSVSNSTLDIPTGTTSTIQIDGTAGTNGTANIPTLTGGGTLNLTSTVADKYFGTFTTSGFTGTLNVAPTAPATLLGQMRIRGGQTDFSNAVVNLTGTSVSNQQGAAANSSVTLGFGELHGDATTSLIAFNGGSIPPDIVWQIGALNTNSDFAGTIVDGAGAASDASISSVTKVGTGKLTLTGANTYTGNTTVQAGILGITNPTLSLADAADVLLLTGAVFDLNFSGTDTIRSLFFDGVSKAVGTWGSLASTATNKSAFFTGTGVLQITTFVPFVLIGDYNNNGVVDAADYTVWRDNLGGVTLQNRDPANTGAISTADYTSWTSHFGMSGPGSGAGLTNGAVPEPSTALLTCMGVAGVCGLGFARRQGRCVVIR